MPNETKWNDVWDWTPEQRDDLAQVQGMFQKFIEQANQLQASVKALEALNTELRELIERASEIVGSAYTVPEWLQFARTERTDQTREMLGVFALAIRPQVEFPK